MTSKMQQHPLSAAFHAMGADDYQALKDSIETIGVQNPITTYEGMVIDGWHRYSAANDLGVECPSVALGDVDPRDYVMAQNKARRHTTKAQLAHATTAVYAWRPVGANQHSEKRVDTGCPPSKTNAELAAIAGVHINSIKQSKAVQAHGTQEVVDAVKAGSIGLRKAAAIAKLPQEEQAAAIAKPLPKPAPAPPSDQVPEADGDALEYTELDALRDQVSDLQAELVVARMGDASDEERQQAANLIAELQAEIKSLKAVLKAVTLSRDTGMQEAAQMKRQMAMQRKELQKLRK